MEELFILGVRIKVIVIIMLAFFGTMQNANAFTIYFGSAKQIKEARYYRKYGNTYSYGKQHYYYHVIKKDAFYIDKNDPSLGSLYLNCGPVSSCPFYNYTVKLRKPPVLPEPKIFLFKYLMLPEKDKLWLLPEYQ